MESATRLNLGDDDHDDHDDEGDDDDDEGGGEGVRVKSEILDRGVKPQTRPRETRGGYIEAIFDHKKIPKMQMSTCPRKSATFYQKGGGQGPFKTCFQNHPFW